MTAALRPLVDSYFYTKASVDAPGDADTGNLGLKDEVSMRDSTMSGGEGFYVDDHGNKQDADIHNSILDAGYEGPEYKAASRQVGQDIGISEDILDQIYGSESRGTYIGTFPRVKETPQYHVVRDQNGKDKWLQKSKHIITHLPDGNVDVHERLLVSAATSAPGGQSAIS